MSVDPSTGGLTPGSETTPKPPQTIGSGLTVITAATGKADCPAFKPLSHSSYPITQQDTDDSRMAAVSNVVRVAMDDSTDVALAAAGDRQAFERLYQTPPDRGVSLCPSMSAS